MVRLPTHYRQSSVTHICVFKCYQSYFQSHRAYILQHKRLHLRLFKTFHYVYAMSLHLNCHRILWIVRYCASSYDRNRCELRCIHWYFHISPVSYFVRSHFINIMANSPHQFDVSGQNLWAFKCTNHWISDTKASIFWAVWRLPAQICEVTKPPGCMLLWSYRSEIWQTSRQSWQCLNPNLAASIL